MKRLLGGLLFAAIVAGAVDLRLMRLMFADRHALARALTQAPDRRAPEYPQFLEQVARKTKRGDSIAILVPMRYWAAGYAYAFFRATYFLAGRRVIPLVDVDDTLHPERLSQADFVASWKMPPPAGPFSVVWRGDGGILLRRAR